MIVHESAPGLLWLGDGQEQQHQHDVRHRPHQSVGRASGDGKLDPARPGGAAVRRARRNSSPPRRRRGARISGRCRSPRRSTRATPRRPASSRRTMSPGCCPASAAPTRRSSIRRITIISASASPTPMATASIMARSTMRPGTAHVLEQARAFARGPRTDRSILFLFVGAEEKGLLGSAYYAANPLYPLSKTVARAQHRRAGRLRARARDFSISGTARLDLLDLLVAQGARQGRRFSPDSRPEAGSFYRSDHFPFAKAGVPAISFEVGQGPRQRRAPRAARPWRATIPTSAITSPTTSIDASWDYSGIVDDGLMLHAVGRDLANGTSWPQWSAGQRVPRRARPQRGRARRCAPAPAPRAGGERG